MTPVPLSKLRTVTRLYLQQDFPALESHPLFAQGDGDAVTSALDQLFLQAANNAIRRAEMANDFNFMVKSLEGTIPSGTGGLSLSGLTEYGGVDTFDVKTIQTVFLRSTDETLSVIRHETRKRMTDRLLEMEDRRQWDQCQEVLEQKALLLGEKVYLYPTNESEDTDIVIDANVWATPLSDDTSTSAFITYGFEYMQWAVICEMNYLLQTFVSRQEGAMAPPTKERDEALRRFIDWDNYQTEANRNIVLD